MKSFLLLLFMLILSGCLLTHKDIAEEEYLDKEKEELSINKDQKEEGGEESLKKKTGVVNKISVMEKISQTEESIRVLRGQIEKMGKAQENRSAELEQGLLVLIQTLDLRVAALAEEVKKRKGEKTKSKNRKFGDDVDLFQTAEKFFKSEEWKKAIISYEQYRKGNKTGEFYRQATFRIGLCFQKLNMSKEAKVFFREVLESFPNSAEAKESKKWLSGKKS